MESRPTTETERAAAFERYLLSKPDFLLDALTKNTPEASNNTELLRITACMKAIELALYTIPNITNGNYNLIYQKIIDCIKKSITEQSNFQIPELIKLITDEFNDIQKPKLSLDEKAQFIAQFRLAAFKILLNGYYNQLFIEYIKEQNDLNELPQQLGQDFYEKLIKDFALNHDQQIELLSIIEANDLKPSTEKDFFKIIILAQLLKDGKSNEIQSVLLNPELEDIETDTEELLGYNQNGEEIYLTHKVYEEMDFREMQLVVSYESPRYLVIQEQDDTPFKVLEIPAYRIGIPLQECIENKNEKGFREEIYLDFAEINADRLIGSNIASFESYPENTKTDSPDFKQTIFRCIDEELKEKQSSLSSAIITLVNKKPSIDLAEAIMKIDRLIDGDSSLSQNTKEKLKSKFKVELYKVYHEEEYDIMVDFIQKPPGTSAICSIKRMERSDFEALKVKTLDGHVGSLQVPGYDNNDESTKAVADFHAATVRLLRSNVWDRIMSAIGFRKQSDKEDLEKIASLLGEQTVVISEFKERFFAEILVNPDHKDLADFLKTEFTFKNEVDQLLSLIDDPSSQKSVLEEKINQLKEKPEASSNEGNSPRHPERSEGSPCSGTISNITIGINHPTQDSMH